MNATKKSAGCYEIKGETSLDGSPATVRFTIWRNDSGPSCWLSETEVNGRAFGVLNDFYSKSDAVRAARRSAKAGYRTHSYLGICGN